jgi:formate dehydrogenase major subunit
MGVRKLILDAVQARSRHGVRARSRSWPVVRQATGGDDRLALGSSARSERSATLQPRTRSADKVVPSICPYCAVGCGQRVFVEDGAVTHIEGDPDSPVSRGRLCPKGSASLSLVTSPSRLDTVRYRPPFARDWQDLPLAQAMDMIADRFIATRAATWQPALRRTMGIGSLGGATLDNEENYLLKKLFTALGAVQIENQARI